MLLLKDRVYSFQECYDHCLERSEECDGFFVGNPGSKVVGYCLLVKAGCVNDGNPNWKYYSKDECTLGKTIDFAKKLIKK